MLRTAATGIQKVQERLSGQAFPITCHHRIEACSSRSCAAQTAHPPLCTCVGARLAGAARPAHTQPPASRCNPTGRPLAGACTCQVHVRSSAAIRETAGGLTPATGASEGPAAARVRARPARRRGGWNIASLCMHQRAMPQVPRNVMLSGWEAQNDHGQCRLDSAHLWGTPSASSRA